MIKIIIFLFFCINILYSQKADIKYEVIYKKECFILNDSILDFKLKKTPYLKIIITNSSNKNIYLEINSNSKLFDFDSEDFNYKYMLHSLYENIEPKFNFKINKLDELFVFEQNCDFNFFVFDLKNEKKYLTDYFELGENDQKFALLNFIFKIQEKLDKLKTNKQLKIFNFKNKDTITFLEAFKLYRKGPLNENVPEIIFLKPNESTYFEKSLIIQKIYGGKYVFRFNPNICELKENIILEDQIYFYPNKINCNEIQIDFN
jgi:hypothetical protein